MHFQENGSNVYVNFGVHAPLTPPFNFITFTLAEIIKVTGTFVPTYFHSQEQKFYIWNLRSLVHSLELSFTGTFVLAPLSENEVELSLFTQS